MIAKRKGKNFKKRYAVSKQKKQKCNVRENPRIRMFLIVARHITFMASHS